MYVVNVVQEMYYVYTSSEQAWFRKSTSLHTLLRKSKALGCTGMFIVYRYEIIFLTLKNIPCNIQPLPILQSHTL